MECKVSVLTKEARAVTQDSLQRAKKHRDVGAVQR